MTNEKNTFFHDAHNTHDARGASITVNQALGTKVV